MPEEEAYERLHRGCQKVGRVFVILLYLSPFCDWVTAP